MKYLSLFTGVGGFELGIGNLGECVGFSEIDKYCNQVLRYKFPKIKNYGDITKINVQELPDFDLIVGGFPCQSFSIAGKRGGFEDTRGTLFFNIAKIAKIKKPRLLLLENVKGLLSHDKGDTFATIITTLDELGYDCQWQVLNSKNFGVPQNRERVFIIGHFRGTSRPKVFPIGESGQKIIKRRKGISEQVASTIFASQHKIARGMDLIKVPSATKKGYEIAEEGDSIRLAHIGSKTGRGRVGKRRSQALTEGGDMYTVQNTEIRKLTPTECERLQGFPNGWTEWGINEKGEKVPISDTQRYKMMGNAVTTNVVQAIVKRLIN